MNNFLGTLFYLQKQILGSKTLLHPIIVKLLLQPNKYIFP